MTRFSGPCSNKPAQSSQYDNSFPDDDDDDDFDDEDYDIDGLTDDDDDDESAEQQSTSRDGSRIAERIGGHSSAFRRHRSLSDCTSNTLEPDDNRRDHHNQLERKRRASIKTSYNDLREAIPSLRGSKASRAVILQRAVECIQDLLRLNRDHTLCVETLRRQNDVLDSRVQELQRYVQRCDDDVASVPYGSSFSATSSINGPLRLCPSSGSGTSGLPVYRLLPSDSAERATTATAVPVGTSNHNGSVPRVAATQGGGPSLSGSSITPSRHTTTSMATILPPTNHTEFTGINALSAAACLLSTGHSAFSSRSPSSGSNCEPAQSSSQRSSPGGLSSSSMSNSSSSHPSCSNPRGADTCEEQPARRDLARSVEAADPSAVAHKSVVVSLDPCPSQVRCSSPPSILLSVPVRSSSINSSPLTDSAAVRTKQSHPIVTLMTTPSESALEPNNLSKRRRV